MNNRQGWETDEVVYLIQFVMFYITFVGGIILLVLILLKKVDFPILGALFIYAVVIALQLGFLVLTSKPMPGDPQCTTSSESDLSADEQIQKEIEELREQNARARSIYDESKFTYDEQS